jgi:GAF domain-containing protein
VLSEGISSRDVHAALNELGELRYEAVDLDQALRRIVDVTHRLFSVDGAGIMLVDPDQLLRVVAYSDERVHLLEDLEIEHGEGPCIDAFNSKQLVDSENLSAEERWPKFAPAAVGQGILASLACPIPYNQEAIGVVTVFSSERRPWSPENELALVAFTDLAALTIANTLASDSRGRLASQLQQALDSRVVIEQAKGAVMSRDGVDDHEAFARIRGQARRERRRLSEVAAEIVASTKRD